ncbi:hypothetical protein HYO65_gp074 [Tenacibaculum phage PTm1]|uniref:Uncharacterized protein n=2 Tax=Shirahamavirus PTm1 TaxID=2846435 RepID=A0A5S9HX67_9CAUD|nr:hypothetical protein HYO65_gp074 [Tenacibaculum phage PTm1]BBI90466.1 hypothetical protein [Tenacibaculum phage PTm1]BBI90773.1 hypothetical protein [Tenacibaculum phage PTm5]
MSSIVYPPHEFDDLVPSKLLTNHEELIVVSTIQWLGSPVGKNFLRECGFIEQSED